MKNETIKDVITMYTQLENEIIDGCVHACLKYNIHIDEEKLIEIIKNYDHVCSELELYKRLYKNKHQRNINIARRCIHYFDNKCDLKNYYCDGKCSRFKDGANNEPKL